MAAGPEGCEIHATQERRLQLRAELRAFRSRPLTVLPLPQADRFALFFEDGELAVYQLPAG